MKGKRFLLPRADIARDLLADALREAGAFVLDVAAYRTIPARAERDGGPDIYRMLLDRQIDAVTFTSASTVKNFVAMLGQDQAVDLLELDRCGIDWSGDGRSRAATRHLDQRHAPTLYDPRSCRRAGRTFREPRSSEPASCEIGPAIALRTTTGASASRPQAALSSICPVAYDGCGARQRFASMVRETRLSADMFLYPLFVCTGGPAARSLVDAGRVSALGRRNREGSGSGQG